MYVKCHQGDISAPLVYCVLKTEFVSHTSVFLINKRMLHFLRYRITISSRECTDSMSNCCEVLNGMSNTGTHLLAIACQVNTDNRIPPSCSTLKGVGADLGNLKYSAASMGLHTFWTCVFSFNFCGLSPLFSPSGMWKLDYCWQHIPVSSTVK